MAGFFAAQPSVLELKIGLHVRGRVGGDRMTFQPSQPPWDVSSPFGDVRVLDDHAAVVLDDHAAVKALATELNLLIGASGLTAC